MYLELETPSVIVDLDALDRNIATMAAKLRAAGIAHRPHIKTHKSIRLAQKQLDAGAIGITVAKLGEAEVFAEAGFDNILVAFPLVGETKLNRFKALHNRIDVLTTVDSLEVARGLSTVGDVTGKPVQVLIELDMGMHRCGVQPFDAVTFAEMIRELPGIEIVGVMEYNALVRDEDSIFGMQSALRQESDVLSTVVQNLRAAGHGMRIVSAGSSVAGTYADVLHGVTELRCGSYIYHDVGSIGIGIAGEADCALRVLATIVSTPTTGRATFDAGSKTLTSDGTHGRTGYGMVVGHPSTVVTSLNEEHGYLEYDPNVDTFAVGDRIEIIPNHACVIPNLTDKVYGVSNQLIIETIRVDARGCNK